MRGNLFYVPVKWILRKPVDKIEYLRYCFKKVIGNIVNSVCWPSDVLISVEISRSNYELFLCPFDLPNHASHPGIQRMHCKTGHNNTCMYEYIVVWDNRPTAHAIRFKTLTLWTKEIYLHQHSPIHHSFPNQYNTECVRPDCCWILDFFLLFIKGLLGSKVTLFLKWNSYSSLLHSHPCWWYLCQLALLIEMLLVSQYNIIQMGQHFVSLLLQRCMKRVQIHVQQTALVSIGRLSVWSAGDCGFVSCHTKEKMVLVTSLISIQYNVTACLSLLLN